MTPTQREGHERHKAFRAHIARLAVPDCVAEKAVCKVAPVKTLQPESFPAEPDPPSNTWVERQKKIWFSIEEEIAPSHRSQVKLDDVYRQVAAEYGLTMTDLISMRRTFDVVLPRQIAFYLARKLTERTYPEIAKRMGGRDHTTVIHGVRKIERLVRQDADLSARIDKLIAAVS